MCLDPQPRRAFAEPDYRTWVGKRVVVRVGSYIQSGIVEACVVLHGAIRLQIRFDDTTRRLVRPHRVEPTWLGRPTQSPKGSDAP